MREHQLARPCDSPGAATEHEPNSVKLTSHALVRAQERGIPLDVARIVAVAGIAVPGPRTDDDLERRQGISPEAVGRFAPWIVSVARRVTVVFSPESQTIVSLWQEPQLWGTRDERLWRSSRRGGHRSERRRVRLGLRRSAESGILDVA